MKTHYGVLVFSCIINFVIACSLNSFSNPELYLPVFFLYFASNLATFVDKYMMYKDMKQTWEQYISMLCIILSTSMVLLYLFHTLNYLEIYFETVCEEYRILIKAVPSSFYTFNSMDITNRVFIIAYIIPATYVVLFVAAYLREEGYTIEKLKNILKMKMWGVIKCVVLSCVLGAVAVGYCFCKYQRTCEGYGSPQWIKYFASFFCTSLVLGLFILIKRNKDVLDKNEKSD